MIRWFDAVVVGGGPAGSAAAIALADAHRSVAILDRGGPPLRRVGEVLPPGVRPALQRLGVWREFLGDGHLPSPGTVVVWGGDEPADQDHVWSPDGQGWHVDRHRFDHMLLTAAERRGATVLRAAHAAGARRHRGGWLVDASGEGGTFRVGGDFLVEATGRAPSLTRLAEARRTSCDRLVAVVATIESSPSADDRLLVEASETGWWYSARTPGSGLVMAWMTEPDVGRGGARRLRTGWRDELDRAPYSRARLGAADVTALTVVAANSCRRRAALERWVAVGDAAAAYDPLAGQGVVRALATGEQAAVAIVATQAGDSGALETYAEAVSRTFDQYLQLRRDYYRTEPRWPQSPFWSRRQAGRQPLTSPP